MKYVYSFLLAMLAGFAMVGCASKPTFDACEMIKKLPEGTKHIRKCADIQTEQASR